MAIEAVYWISSGAAEPRIPGGIIPQECSSPAKGTPHAGLGGTRRRRRRRWGDKGSGRGEWELPPTEASGDVWGLK